MYILKNWLNLRKNTFWEEAQDFGLTPPKGVLLVGIPGCGFFSWFMGFIGDKYGLPGALMVVPASLTVFITVIYLECWKFAPRNSVKQ